jgi:hypothetical protein
VSVKANLVTFSTLRSPYRRIPVTGVTKANTFVTRAAPLLFQVFSAPKTGVSKIHERSESSPRRCLVTAGISTASVASTGGVWVIGMTPTSGRFAGFALKNQHDGAGTILHAFFPSFARLPFPQIGVTDNQTGTGSRPAHGFQSFNSSSRCS